MATLSSILPPVNVSTASGTLPVSNGGTGVTTSTGSGSTVLSTSPTLVTPILGAASATSITAALGSASAPSFTFTGDTNTGIFSPAADTIAFAEGGVEAMRLDSSGNVGIGAVTTNGKLTIKSPSATGDQVILNVQGATNTQSIGRLSYNQTDDTMRLFNESTFAGSGLLFGTSNTERMRIDNSGNVGIGTSSPSSKLTVSGQTVRIAYGTSNTNELFPTYSFYNTTNSVELASIVSGTGSAANNGVLTFNTASGGTNAERMRLDTSGNLGLGTSTINGFYGSGSVATRQAISYTSSSADANAAPKGLVIRNDDTTTGNLSQLVFGTTNTGNTPIATASIWSINDARTSGFSTGSMAFGTVGGSGVISERMRITSAGSVGIGTTAPDMLLDVVGTGRFRGDLDIYAPVGGAVNSSFQYFGSAALPRAAAIYSKTDTATAGNLVLATAQSGTGTITERMRIDASGNVLIGRTSGTGAKLDVYNSGSGDAAVRIGNIQNGSTTDVGKQGASGYGATGAGESFLYSSTSLSIMSDTGAGIIKFSAGGNAEKMRLTAAGNLIINETAQVAYGGNTPKLEVLSASVTSSDADGGSLGLIGSTNTAGGGGALVLGSLFQAGAWGTFGRIRGSKNNGTSGDYGGGIAFDTRANGSNFAERMLINSSGNVGIGTSNINGQSSDNRVLQIYGAGTGNRAQIHLCNSNTGETATDGSFIGVDSSTSLYISNGEASSTIFEVNGSERARIDSSGNLLVGTTVMPNSTTAGMGYNRSSTFLSLSCGTTTTSVVQVYFTNGNGTVGSIATNGSYTVYNTSSDYRLKDIDGPITNSGAYIDALKPVQGSWKADGSRFIGLIAHEVQEVSETNVATGVKDGAEMQAMDYSSPEIIANLIAELQSVRARLAQLEGK